MFVPCDKPFGRQVKKPALTRVRINGNVAGRNLNHCFARPAAAEYAKKPDAANNAEQRKAHPAFKPEF
jgi:hypothetical protein